MMKKVISGFLAAAVALCMLAGCGAEAGFDPAIRITVVSREDGSGTRGAFVELLGIEETQPGGSKRDGTTLEAVIVNSTSVVMTIVASDPYAIGYISLGSLNDTVQALTVDGAAPTAENIENGSYTVARPFNIATTGSLSAAAQDFIRFILSADGQAVVAASGYIPMAASEGYVGNKPTGKVVVAGSSSVTPVMEKLKEAYVALNPNVEIEIQQSDSSTGMSATADGICDIGMASRQLKESELAAGLVPTVIAMDGIVIIANSQNPTTGLSSEQVKRIYTGEAPTWADVD